MSLADRLPDPGEGYLNRIYELTRQRDELHKRLGGMKRAYAALELELELERQHSRILGERFDALRSELPTYGSRVERWLRGEADCL